MFEIIFLVWFVGFITAIYPIYRAMTTESTRSHIAAKKREAERYSERFNIESTTGINVGDMTIMAVLSTCAALFWIFMMPFFISHMVHTRRKYRGMHQDLSNIHEELVEHYKQGERLKRAALEVGHAEDEGTERYYNNETLRWERR